MIDWVAHKDFVDLDALTISKAFVKSINDVHQVNYITHFVVKMVFRWFIIEVK